MISELPVPFRDARAEHLTLDLRTGAGPRRKTLASLHLRFGPVDLDLCILGASHEVRVTAGDDVLSEVVACDSGGDGPLPRHRELSQGGLGYTFRARVLRCTPRTLQRMASALERHGNDNPDVLIGRFPGHPNAMTALHARHLDAAVEWRTWHLYPSSSEVVRTRSVLRVA